MLQEELFLQYIQWKDSPGQKSPQRQYHTLGFLFMLSKEGGDKDAQLLKSKDVTLYDTFPAHNCGHWYSELWHRFVAILLEATLSKMY